MIPVHSGLGVEGGNDIAIIKVTERSVKEADTSANKINKTTRQFELFSETANPLAYNQFFPLNLSKRNRDSVTEKKIAIFYSFSARSGQC